jgi:hypothetical protein
MNLENWMWYSQSVYKVQGDHVLKRILLLYMYSIFLTCVT